MLKIKDNVDLKELEKYGFKKDEFQMLSSDKKDYVYCFGMYEYLCVLNDRKIKLYIDDELYAMYVDEHCFDLLYDLIKADLVEKVQDE